MNFSVNAASSSIDHLVLGFDETCNGAPANVAPLFHFKTLAITEGKFSGAATDHFGKTVSDALVVSGSFSDGKATGKVTSRSYIKSLGTCTQSEPFTASLKK